MASFTSSASTCSSSSHSNSSSTESNTTTATDQPFYFDEKWKLSKKESRSSTSPVLMKNSSESQRRCAFARKCARLVKEQRARFYIMRRCVIMLICWHE